MAAACVAGVLGALRASAAPPDRCFQPFPIISLTVRGSNANCWDTTPPLLKEQRNGADGKLCTWLHKGCNRVQAMHPGCTKVAIGMRGVNRGVVAQRLQ